MVIYAGDREIGVLWVSLGYALFAYGAMMMLSEWWPGMSPLLWPVALMAAAWPVVRVGRSAMAAAELRPVADLERQPEKEEREEERSSAPDLSYLARRAEMLTFLTKVMQYNRDLPAEERDDHRLWPWRDLGMSARQWVDLTDILAWAGYCRKEDTGTYLPGHSMRELFALVYRDEINLFPPAPLQTGEHPGAERSPERWNIRDAPGRQNSTGR